MRKILFVCTMFLSQLAQAEVLTTDFIKENYIKDKTYKQIYPIPPTRPEYWISKCGPSKVFKVKNVLTHVPGTQWGNVSGSGAGPGGWLAELESDYGVTKNGVLREDNLALSMRRQNESVGNFRQFGPALLSNVNQDVEESVELYREYKLSNMSVDEFICSKNRFD